MIYLALLNNVVKAVNLFLNKYVAEIQLTGNSIWLPFKPQRLFYTEFWHGLALEKNKKSNLTPLFKTWKCMKKSTTKSILIQFRRIVPDALPTMQRLTHWYTVYV